MTSIRNLLSLIPKNVATRAFRNGAPVNTGAFVSQRHSHFWVKSIGGKSTAQFGIVSCQTFDAGLTILGRYSTDSKGVDASVDLSFNDLQALLKSGDIQLIDVREPKELIEYGEFPGAVNIPLGRVKEALSMPDGDFRTTFGSPKPEDSKVVFACLKGIRSRTAVDLAKLVGFTKTRHYKGGWDDYHKQMGLPLKRISSSR